MKRALLSILWFCCLARFVLAAPAAHDGSDRFVFPEAKPEHVGMDTARLAAARDYALRGGGSGCILRGGRLVMTWGDQRARYDIFSSTKSIGVTALGLATMDGKVSLHDPAKRYLPSVGVPPEGNAPSGWLDGLTLWHLATQTGGFEKTRGWCRQLKQPGTTWMYSDGGPNWLADCLTMAYGMKESFLAVIPSLDLVAVRAGDYLAPSEHPERSDTYNNLVKPFLLPICQSVALGAPHPPSPVITSIAWAPENEILCLARHADNWPITWADDGHQYTSFGDGWGFQSEFPPATKRSLGFCRIEGDPPNVRGFNLHSDGDREGDGARGKKASGLLCVGGVLYGWVRNAESDTGRQSQLAWSADHGSTWRWSAWKFAEFGYPCFLNFGENYTGARDEFVYVYSPDTPSAYYETDHVVLLRVRQDRIRDRGAYEFLKALDPQGQPVWTAEVGERGAVFRFPGGCNRMDVTWSAGLRRYLLVMRSRPNMAADAGLPDPSRPGAVNQFSIYDAPEPWGPWTTVYYTEQWEGKKLKDLVYWQGWGESAHLPSKWMSADGKTVHLVFAGGPGGFSIRRAELTSTIPAGMIPSGANTPRAAGPR